MTFQNLIGSRPARDRDAALLRLLALALLGAGVFSLVLLSIVLTRFNGHPSALWPANALVIAALLRSSGRRWPAILITGLVAEFAARLACGDPTALGAGLAGADTLAIVVCAAGVRRLVGPSLDLTRMRHLLTFLAFGGLAGPLVGAGIAAGVLGLAGGSAIQTLTGRFAATALGALVLTPALLVVSVQELRPLFERRNLRRTLGSGVLLLACLAIVFGQARFPAGFLMMPVLLIITVQLEMVGGALALLITAAVGVFCTLHGTGVASIVAGGMGKQLLMLQLFLLVQTTSILPVAAVRGGRRRVEAELNSALAEARSATAAALDASRVAQLATRIAHLGHWRIDLATGEGAWSEQVSAIHGFDPVNRNLTGPVELDLYHPDDRAAIVGHVAEARATGKGFDLKARFNRASDGVGRIVAYKGEVECDADGSPIALVGVIQDITEAETAHKRIEDSEARYRLIADSAKDIIIKGGPKGIHYISESVRRYGYSPEDLVGRPAIDLIHPDDHTKVAAIIADLFALGDVDPTRDRTYRMLTAAGDAVWMEGSPSVVRGPDGAVTGVITLVRDISDRKAVETALVESEARYRLMADSASDVLVHYDTTGIRYVSEACRRYGYAPEDLVGRSPASLVHPDDIAKVMALNQELLANGFVDPTRDRTSRFITASGEAVWIEGSPSIVRDAEGAPIGVINLFRDISDRIAAAQAMAESEARYRLLAENSTDVIGCYGADATFTFMSPAIRAVLGYEPEELVGRRTTDFMHPDDIKRVMKLFAAYLVAGPGSDPIQFEYRARHRDGMWVWLEAHPKAIYSPVTGEFVEFQDTVREISERKAAEAALADSEARYRQISDHASDWITRTNAIDGRLSYLSPSTEAVTGYAVDELLGMRLHSKVHPDDFPRVQAAVAALLASDQDTGEPIEYRLRHKSGDWVWLEGNPTLVRDADGRPFEFVDVTRDITVHKHLETELRGAMDQAEAATAAKSEFLSNMSHELRTPLTSIIGFAALLNDTPGLPGEAPRYVQRVATASGNLLTLVNDILDFSKLEAGQVNLDYVSVCPEDLAQELAGLFEIQASAKGLRLEVVIEGELPPSVSLDPTRVRQVMSNLIGNALKFTEAGVITVGLSHDGSDLSVSVTDTGPGVPADRLDRLFKRFSQVDASTTRTHGGTGLGLAICQGLIEAMGGEIGVTSTFGQGSTFRFRIPAPAVAAALALAQGDLQSMSLEGLRVLVADDNPANRELARVVLQAQGVEVTEAEDGQAAVGLALSLPYDVILMDIRMPVMDGLEAVARLRAEPGPNQDIPILAFSADGDLERLKGLTEQGFDGMAHKPIVPADLITAICRCLQWEAPGEEEGEARAS